MHTEDTAARTFCEARDANTALFKRALADPIPIRVPLGGTTLEMHKALRDQRPRAEVVPFRKAAPAPQPTPQPPSQPLRPAAKVARSTTRKLQEPLDTKQRAELADLFRTTMLKAVSR